MKYKRSFFYSIILCELCYIIGPASAASSGAHGCRPAVSEDGIQAEEIGDAADGGAHGPEDELDQVGDDLLDGLLHAPDDAQDGVVVTALSAEASKKSPDAKTSSTVAIAEAKEVQKRIEVTLSS